MNSTIYSKILQSQRNEITEYTIYKKLATQASRDNNKKVLQSIAEDELSHYNFWKTLTKKEVKPHRLKVLWYYYVAKYLGINFGIRLMEAGEDAAQVNYQELEKAAGEGVGKIIRDEERHERELIQMIDKEELKYTSSIILGLNDALVELTGVLAGFTFALQNTRLIAIVGLITGIAASLSMSASGYLSSKEEESKNPIRSSIYTGFAYLFTVILLIAPYFIFKSPYVSLLVVIIIVVCIIFAFNFYISVAKELSFKKRFFEMICISLGVAILNFFIGFLVRKYLHIDV